MTLNELRERVRVTRGSGYCCYNVTITWRGKQYTCHSNNSPAWDRLDDINYGDNEVIGLYTNKGAYEAFYEECKRKNHLGEYNY